MKLDRNGAHTSRCPAAEECCGSRPRGPCELGRGCSYDSQLHSEELNNGQTTYGHIPFCFAASNDCARSARALGTDGAGRWTNCAPGAGESSAPCGMATPGGNCGGCPMPGGGARGDCARSPGGIICEVTCCGAPTGRPGGKDAPPLVCACIGCTSSAFDYYIRINTERSVKGTMTHRQRRLLRQWRILHHCRQAKNISSHIPGQ